MKIQGQQFYLWRAVDQDGDVLDILATKRRNTKAAKRFFRKVLKGQGEPPWKLITDKLSRLLRDRAFSHWREVTCAR